MMINQIDQKNDMPSYIEKTFPIIMGSITRLNPIYLLKYNIVMFLTEMCAFIVISIIVFQWLFV